MNECFMRNQLYTFFIIALCILSSSIEPILAKFTYQHFPVTPWSLLLCKFFFGGFVALSLLSKTQKIALKDFRSIGPMALLLIVTGGFVFAALKYISASMVITVITTTPAFVAMVNSILGKDRLSKTFWLGFILCFLGIVLTLDIVGGNTLRDFSQGSIKGFVFAGLSVVLSTIYRVSLDKVTNRYAPITLSAWMFLICGVGSGVMIGTCELNNPTLIAGLILGIAAVCANVTFVKAVQLLGSTKMSMVSLIQRPVVIFFAAVFLSEPLSPIQIAGIAMVILGIHFAKVEKKCQSRV